VTYAAVARDLHDFFVVAGTSAATLAGLLFVGLSLHLRTVIAASEIRGLARITLANFGAVLFVSMFMVLNEDRLAAGWQLIGTGLVTIVFAAPSLWAASRSHELTGGMTRTDRLRFFLRFGLSALAYIAIVAAGALLLASQLDAFSLVVMVAVIVLMVVALRNTWDLLVTVGEVASEDEPRRRR
jgi:hypothetical protein